MSAKEYLQQLKRLDTIINQKLRELADLGRMLTGFSGMDMSKDRVQKSPAGDAPFVSQVNRMIDLEEEINREIDRFVREKHRIINQIHGLPDTRYVEILYKIYVEFKPLEKVADEMGYSEQYIRNLQKGALREFEDAYL